MKLLKKHDGKLKKKIRLFLLEFSVFLSEHVEVDWTPEASSLSPDDHDGGGVDWQEDPGAAAAVPRVFHSFARSGFK